MLSLVRFFSDLTSTVLYLPLVWLPSATRGPKSRIKEIYVEPSIKKRQFYNLTHSTRDTECEH